MDLKKGLSKLTKEDKIVVNTIIESILELWDIIEILGLYHPYYLFHLTKLII